MLLLTMRSRIIIIGIQPLGRFGQIPELGQATGMALVRCILGKFLGAACHCFPRPPDRTTFSPAVPPFAAGILHVVADVEAPGGESGKLLKKKSDALSC
jgi:hypothetical protein